MKILNLIMACAIALPVAYSCGGGDSENEPQPKPEQPAPTPDPDPEPDPVPDPDPDPEQPAVQYKFGEIIFEDDFNQASRIPDQSKWELCAKSTPAWTRHLSNSYDQAFVENGNLVLTAEKKDGTYLCGGVRMLDDHAVKYGKIQVRARFTKTGRGCWPAIWMMPSEPIWSGWPQCGEIDIMEHLNNETVTWSVVHSHWVDNLGGYYNPVYSATTSVDPQVYNTYTLEWTPEYMKFYVNEKLALDYGNLHMENEEQCKQWPFDAPFYLILNHALGNAPGQTGAWPGDILDAELPAKFEIDWVKVAELIIEE
ncbi:MAG: glycoside hydrolase family 16 protein [Muribaculaceae bacterium]|nr:glycoside hydrolase family 16 protein [Muribaculaceae bacterium]